MVMFDSGWVRKLIKWAVGIVILLGLAIYGAWQMVT